MNYIFSWLCLHTIFLTSLIYISSMIEVLGSSLVPQCHAIGTVVWTASPASPASPLKAHANLPREPGVNALCVARDGLHQCISNYGGLQSWSSLVLLASVRFGQPSRTSGNTAASRPRSQHCHLRLPGSSS